MLALDGLAFGKRVRLAVAGDGLDGPCLVFFAFSLLLSWSEDGTIVLLSGLLWWYKVWRRFGRADHLQGGGLACMGFHVRG